jgi:hypothetical protein
LIYGLASFVVTNNDDAKPSVIASTFGNIVADIVGFYFGQRTAQEARAQVKEVESQNSTLRNTGVKIDEAKEGAEDYLDNRRVEIIGKL